MTKRLTLLAIAGLVLAPQLLLAQALYRHVDENGKVTYSDRPQKPDQKAVKPPPVNVSSPEARRQLYEEQRNSQREEMLERRAQQQRAGAVARREHQERLRQQQLEREKHPEHAPRPIQIVR